MSDPKSVRAPESESGAVKTLPDLPDDALIIVPVRNVVLHAYANPHRAILR